MQEAQVKSRSLAVAMQSLQRQQSQWPPSARSDSRSQPMQQSVAVLKSSMRKQSVSSPGMEVVDRLRPMTAGSVLQAKLGAPASILTRPASALSR